MYNDFYIADGADVVIIAGCGIHNSGCNDSRHNGIHSFHVGKNANVRYEEKHYGEGEGTGARILDPVTKIYIGEDSVFTLDTAQIKGVDSTKRETEVELDAGAKLYVIEKLMTHGSQFAESNMEVRLTFRISHGLRMEYLSGCPFRNRSGNNLRGASFSIQSHFHIGLCSFLIRIMKMFSCAFSPCCC